MKGVSANFTDDQLMAGLQLLYDDITVSPMNDIYSIKKKYMYHELRPIVP